MKLRVSLPVILVALFLIPSLTLAASASGPQTDAAASRLFADLASAASPCNATVSPALAPEPLFLTGLPCGACSNAACAGKSVGDRCGVGLVTHCESGISCQSGQITCKCQ